MAGGQGRREERVTPGSLALDWPGPEPDAEGANAGEVARLLAGAPYVVRLVRGLQRLAAASLEACGAIAWIDADGGFALRAAAPALCSGGA
jgi:hypothetical protein